MKVLDHWCSLLEDQGILNWRQLNSDVGIRNFTPDMLDVNIPVRTRLRLNAQSSRVEGGSTERPIHVQRDCDQGKTDGRPQTDRVFSTARNIDRGMFTE